LIQFVCAICGSGQGWKDPRKLFKHYEEEHTVTTDLVTIEPQAISPYEDPEEVVVRATAWANSLMDLVRSKGMVSNIQGKEYLQVEGWQVIGAFAGVHAMTDWVRPFDVDGETVGYEAKVLLMRGNEQVSSGIMTCGFAEFPCRGREGMAKVKACMSAAQTWAESKAYRMKFAFVAKLAGFEPTPADEMHETPPAPQGSASAAPTPQHDESTAVDDNQCPIHAGKDWFKTPKMRGYAHPGAEGESWCNQKDVLDSLDMELKETVEVMGREKVVAFLKERGGWNRMSAMERQESLNDLANPSTETLPADHGAVPEPADEEESADVENERLYT
jgi:hypothetical protein